MSAEKPKTTDEYVLAELEKSRMLSTKYKKRIDELEELLAQKVPVPPEPTIEETKFKCYSSSCLSPYSSDWDKLTAPLTTAKMKDILDDENLFRAWATTATYKNYSGEDKVLNVHENLYNFEINYFGTLIGIGIHRYYGSEEITVNPYVLDDKHYFADPDACKEAGLQELRSNFKSVYDRRCKEEAAKAASATTEKEE